MSARVNQLKQGGFIKQRQPDYFLVRVRVVAGDLKADQLKKLAEISEKYGAGWVHLSVRQGVEITNVKIEDFEDMIRELEEVGLSTGACGPRARVIVACQGSSICPYGICTKEMARKLDERIYGRSDLPHKFKISICGCSNACTKPQENDVGFMGMTQPVFDEVEGICTTCGLCAEACRFGAITFDDEGKPIINLSKCISDGRCIRSCPTGAIRTAKVGWRMFIGGNFGYKPQLGIPVKEFVSDDEVVDLAEKVLITYQKHGEKGERLREVIKKNGIGNFLNEVGVTRVEPGS